MKTPIILADGIPPKDVQTCTECNRNFLFTHKRLTCSEYCRKKAMSYDRKKKKLRKNRSTWLSKNHSYIIKTQPLVRCEMCFKPIKHESYALCSCGDRLHKTCTKKHQTKHFKNSL